MAIQESHGCCGDLSTLDRECPSHMHWGAFSAKQAVGGVFISISQSFAEHLAILDAVEAGDRDLAAERMREHILAANAKRPDFRKIRTLAHRRLTRR